MEYALYKGDVLLGIGTRKELAKLINVKPKTISFYASPTYLKRHKNSKYKNYKLAIRLEDK